jgi:glutamyl-Q tRNA(Asp) synthetase
MYRGRFAPSPTGALHAGSLVAALASWLDARAHGGQWLVRIEDVDTPRCVQSADQEILQQLATCGLLPDEPPVYQSQRSNIYQTALDQLIAAQAAYPCACSRKDIETALAAAQGQSKPRHGELVYPGTCRTGLHGKPARAWRMHTGISPQKQHLAPVYIELFATNNIANSSSTWHWHDRRLGAQQQDIEHEVGDFVLQRADGLWAYQLAVVVDDAAQGITHVVRGEDLADNTARQILLQQALGYPRPAYLHTPLVLAPDGHKLSKQNGAVALDLSSPAAVLQSLNQAAQALGLQPSQSSTDQLSDHLSRWVHQWKHLLATNEGYAKIDSPRI